jgi:cobalt/nickel transport system ATP-binding protein
MNDEVVVDVDCLEHVYPDGVRVDTCGLAFRVHRGQRVAVLGPNGSGKSTLLKHVLGILKPTSGRVTVFGKDPAREYAQIRSRIGAVMQNVDEQLIGPTVFEDVAFAPLNFGFSREDTCQRVERTLKALGIWELRDRLPHYLSGGERKKVALAGALVIDPALLVLDEPLEGVDYASRREITRFLQGLHDETGMAMILTAHDMEVVADLADYGYVMGPGGGLALSGALAELFFDHDLSDYNLAPPILAQAIRALHAQGIDIETTTDVEGFAEEIRSKLRTGEDYRGPEK